MGDQEYKLYLRLYKETSVTEANLQMIEQLIHLLSKTPYRGFADHLNELLMTDFMFDFGDQEKYFAELKRCWNISRSLKIDFDLKTLQLESVQKRFKKNAKPTKEYFQSVLITLSDDVQYRILDDITVYEFCDRMHRHNLKCEQAKTKAKK